MSDRRKSTLERQQDRATFHDAVPAVVTLIVLEVAVAWLDLDPDSNRWYLLISLSPLLAGVWLAVVQVRSLRRCDEYQRTMHLEAMSIGFGTSMLLAMAGGLLSGADVGSDAQYLQVTFI